VQFSTLKLFLVFLFLHFTNHITYEWISFSCTMTFEYTGIYKTAINVYRNLELNDNNSGLLLIIFKNKMFIVYVVKILYFYHTYCSTSNNQYRYRNIASVVTLDCLKYLNFPDRHLVSILFSIN